MYIFIKRIYHERWEEAIYKSECAKICLRLRMWIIMPIMKNGRKVCDEKKFGSNASFVSVFSFFSLLVYTLPQRVRDCPRSGIKRRTIGAGRSRAWNARGWREEREAKKYEKKKTKSRIWEQEGKEKQGTPKLFEVIAIRSRFSPFTSPSFASFFFLFFFFFPAAVLSTLSSEYDRRHVFARARVPLPALYACK